MAGHSTRRKFLQSTTTAGAAIAAPMVIPASLLGGENGPAPSEEVRVGVIGTGNRARQLMSQLPAPGKLVAIADCYQQRMVGAEKQLKRKFSQYDDYRKMFDNEQLDAVIIATPDHGRSLPCVLACQAGLDVYAEKPLTAYVAEGREVVRAARKHNRIFQVGTQQRTMDLNRFCCDFVRNGGLGEIKLVQAVNYVNSNPYPGIDELPEETIPSGDNWDVWCGPTPVRPFNPGLQFGWMRWHDYSGGEMTNWGAHGVDQVQWCWGWTTPGRLKWRRSETPTAVKSPCAMPTASS